MPAAGFNVNLDILRDRAEPTGYADHLMTQPDWVRTETTGGGVVNFDTAEGLEVDAGDTDGDVARVLGFNNLGTHDNIEIFWFKSLFGVSHNGSIDNEIRVGILDNSGTRHVSYEVHNSEFNVSGTTTPAPTLGQNDAVLLEIVTDLVEDKTEFALGYRDERIRAVVDDSQNPGNGGGAGEGLFEVVSNGSTDKIYRTPIVATGWGMKR